MITINQPFPNYKLTAVNGTDPNTAFSDQVGDELKGQWRVYLFWPKDFTFVCPTEIKAYGDRYADFKDRDAELIGVSTDSEFVHMAWRQHHADLKDNPFPWLADIKKTLSTELGVLDEQDGVANRATIIVDPHGIVQNVSVNSMSVGRNPNETLRILDALQTDELCPCNWQPGDDVIQA